MVAADAPLLVAAASGRPCVCWVVTSGLLTGPLKQEGQPFFVKDAGGEILVLPDRFTARLGGREQHADLEVVDADVRLVSDQLATVRDKLREKRDPEVVQQRKTLRKLYTLLCAIRAHARGHCHVGKSLEGQERFIAKNTALFASEFAPKKLRTLELTREETILTVGQQVRVTGVASRRVDGLAAGSGYRERSTRLVLSAPEDEPLLIIGEGAEEAEQERRIEAAVTPEQNPVRLQFALGLMLAILALAGWLLTR